MVFKDFIGNEKIKQQLTYLDEAGRFPHALIIEGEEGLGKRTLAREIALNLFCKSEAERACRICPQCSKVLKGIHPDIFEYTAPDKVAGFHVDKVREIRQNVFVRPNEADYKIYILSNSQSMNAAAQNALLKILEEPPSYVIFILCVTNKSAMLETVLSRSVVITLEGVETGEAVSYITEHYDNIEYTDALSAVEAWNGNIGKAIESLNNGKLSMIASITNDVARAVISENEYELIKACSVFEKNKDTLVASCVLLKSIFRDALIGGDSISGQRETSSLLASRLSKKKLLSLIEAADNIRLLAQRNGNNAILITKLSYELRRAVGR